MTESPGITGISGKNPLIGREKEWKALVKRCERAREGQGGLLLIEGEAGIGKSTLIAHLDLWARARGFSHG